MTQSRYKIKARLYPNLMKNSVGGYLAQVTSERTLDIKDICAEATTNHPSGVNANTMEYHVGMFLEQMADLMANGYAVNTGYFIASPSIKGAFAQKHDNFDSEKQKVVFQFSQGNILRRIAAELEVDILPNADSNLNIAEVTDIKTGSVNAQITPNRNLLIKGEKLKLTGSNPDVGVYFINQTTNEHIKVPPEDITLNLPTRLIIVIPELQAGTYRLQTVTQFAGKSIPLKVPRTYIFQRLLFVI